MKNIHSFCCLHCQQFLSLSVQFGCLLKVITLKATCKQFLHHKGITQYCFHLVKRCFMPSLTIQPCHDLPIYSEYLLNVVLFCFQVLRIYCYC